jgi:hypothetical protein
VIIHGSSEMARDMVPVSRYARRRCACCGSRETHMGRGGGVVLMSGCQWYVRKWVRSPSEAMEYLKRKRNQRLMAAEKGPNR